MVLRDLADRSLKDDQLARVDGGTVEDCVKSWVVDAWVAVVVQAPCFIVPTKLSLHFHSNSICLYCGCGAQDIVGKCVLGMLSETNGSVSNLPSFPRWSLGLYMKLRVDKLRTKMKLASRMKPNRMLTLPFSPTLKDEQADRTTLLPFSHLELHHLANNLVCV